MSHTRGVDVKDDFSDPRLAPADPIAHAETPTGASGSYLGELRNNLAGLVAASAGYAVGLQLNSYTSGLFAPRMIEEFGWSKAQFALIGAIVFILPFWIPIVGRLTDVFGPRRLAFMGVLGLPLLIVAFSLTNDNFWLFAILNALYLFVGCFTNSIVYTRVAAERFKRARGIALTIIACGPAALAIALVPLLDFIIGTYGWRAGYRLLALFIAVVGLLAISRLPQSRSQVLSHGQRDTARFQTAYREIVRVRAFWIISIGLLLCLLPTCLQTSQLKLLLLAQQLSPPAATAMLSWFAAATMIGRLTCGLALDRFPTPVVAFVSMLLPAVGFLILAAGANTLSSIAIAIFLIGAAYGAEADLVPFLVARYFRPEIYGTAFGLIMGAMSLAAASGSLILSYTLTFADTFDVFVVLMVAATASGSVVFLLLYRQPGCLRSN